MKIRTLVTIAVSFIVGAGAGFLWAGHAFKQFESSKEVDFAGQTAFDAATLAMLRLNDTNKAIETLESQMDAKVSTLAIWDTVQPPDEKTRLRRDHLLTNVKVYHQSFPVRNDEADVTAMVNSFLDKIPGRSTNSTCKGPICRLDDVRLARLMATNSAGTK